MAVLCAKRSTEQLCVCGLAGYENYHKFPFHNSTNSMQKDTVRDLLWAKFVLRHSAAFFPQKAVVLTYQPRWQLGARNSAICTTKLQLNSL